MSVVAKINLDPSGFNVGARAVELSFKALSTAAAKAGSLISTGISKGISGIASLAKKAVVGAAGGLVGLGAGVYEAMSEGGELVDLQEQTGIAVDTLMALRVAFEQAGMGADDVQPTIAKLQKSVVEAQTGSEAAAKAFGALGLSAETLAGMTADEQLQAVGDAIKGIQDPAVKSAVAMEIFGKSGARMLAFFATGGLDDAREAIGRQADLMKRYADTFDGITDAFGLYHVKLRGFFVGLAAELAPVLKLAADFFKTLDFAALGEQVGNTIMAIYQAIRGGDIGGLLTASLKVAFGDGINFLNAGLQATFAGIGALFKDSLGGLSSYASGFGSILMGIGKMFAELLLDAVASVLLSMRELPVIGEKFAVAGSALQTTAYRMGVAGSQQMQQGADAMANSLPSLDSFGNRLMSTAKAFAAEFQRAQGVPVIDTDAEKEKIAEIMAKGREAAAEAQRTLNAQPRAAEAPQPERGILDVLGKQQEFKFSRAQQVFGQFGTLGGGVVRGTFQSFDPMVNQQRQTNSLLQTIRENTARTPMVAAPAYQS
jgi:hypothetical protein